MENMSSFQTKVCFAKIFCFFTFLCVQAGPMYIEEEGKLSESNDFMNTGNSSSTLDCKPVEYSLDDVIFLKTNDIFLKTENTTVNSTEYRKEGGKILICPPYQHISSEEIILNCTDKFVYESHEFEILPNTSALVHGSIVLPEEYILKGTELLTCAPDFEDYSDIDDISTGITLSQVSIYVGQIGSAISIISLIVHLIIFGFVPTLRNLPGFNLASLSVAFMLGYSFALIGQIPEVLGLFCVISGVLQQNFFLSAFFCMNVLAFDVWRTLKLATEKFAVGSQSTKKRRYIWYSMYAWGCPLVISTISVVVDNCDVFPDSIKPYYGRNDTCWLTNNTAKTIFFAAPALTLIVINVFFFIRSSWIISSNTMKSTNDQNKQSVRLNYILYVRLALMMGLTWLMGVIAVISNNEILWFIFDILNSLQGLFLFLLFTCTRKVLKHLREKSSSKSLAEKQTTLSSNSITASHYITKH